MFSGRKLTLLSFSLSTLTNGMLWITFSNINSLAKDYFSVSGAEIDTLAVCFLIFYIPSSLFGLWIFTRFNLRVGILLGSGFTCIGGWLRYFSCIEDHSYSIVLFGQCLAAFAQPFLTNTPSKVAGRFFPTQERDLATAILVLSNPTGIALGTTLPSLFVSRNDGNVIEGMDSLLLFQASLSTFAFGLVFSFFPNQPNSLTPHQSFTEDEENFQEGFFPALKLIRMQMNICFSNPQFLTLFISGSIGIGIFNTISTLLEQMVTPFCYDSQDASLFSAGLLFSGLLSSVVVSFYLDQTKAYSQVLKLGNFFSFCMLFLISIFLRPGFKKELTISFCFLGLFYIPMGPAIFQALAETTFPCPEHISSFLVLSNAQILGIVFTYILGIFIRDQEKNCVGFVYTTYSLILTLLGLLSLLPVLLFKGENKRLNVELSHQLVEGG